MQKRVDELQLSGKKKDAVQMGPTDILSPKLCESKSIIYTEIISENKSVSAFLACAIQV